MRYDVRYSAEAIRNMKKMDKATVRTLNAWIEENLLNCADPRERGKALSGDKRGLWRYRVGDYRIIAEIRDTELIILIMGAGHRSKVYLTKNKGV